MISTKTNTGKLPLPERKHKDGVLTFAAQPAALNAAAIEAGKIVGDMPAFLDATKTPTAKATKAGTVAALAAQIQDPEKRAAVEKADAEKTTKRTIKRAVKAERKKAAETGATKAMPLTGSAAVKAIRKAAKESAKADDKSGGKAAVRAAAKKVVTEVKAKKASSATKAPRITSYDWDGAQLKAKSGTIPPTPPFASYGPHMKKAHDMAKAGQAKELREYLKGFTADPCPPSRKNLFRYGELCLTALKGAASGGAGKDA